MRDPIHVFLVDVCTNHRTHELKSCACSYIVFTVSYFLHLRMARRLAMNNAHQNTVTYSFQKNNAAGFVMATVLADVQPTNNVSDVSM
jgi:predicted Na+-dependent transporter